MRVQRITKNVTQGCMEEVIEFLKEHRKKHGFTYRLYQSNFGTADQIAFEMEFEDLTAYEKFWADWFATPDMPAFGKRFIELVKAGGKNELWNLIE